MDRWLRFRASGAHLARRVKDGPKSLPVRIRKRVPDGSYPVVLRESDAMRAKRREDTRDPRACRRPSHG